MRSSFHTYNLPPLISNCSNNYGPQQHDEKLIPTIIRKALLGNKIPIYGKGENVRDWLYVTDHCLALDKIFHKGRLGENDNIGTTNEKKNLAIAYLICEILEKLRPLKNSTYKQQIAFVKDRLGHDFRYAIDNSKITKELNWQANLSFHKALEATVKWFVDKYE